MDKIEFTDARQAWAAFSAGTANGYAVDIAATLSLREGQLVAQGCGENVVRLDADWGELIMALPTLGEVKILTRNSNVVHEKIGQFGKISINGDMGLVLNGDIDLRLFLGRWGHGFAVRTENARAGTRHSLQFFDHDGSAIHKIFMTENSDLAAYQALVGKYRAADQGPGMDVLPPLPDAIYRADQDVDVENLRAHWRRMSDVHQFHGMLKDFNIDRHQGLRLVGAEFAERLDPAAHRVLLEQAAASGLPIMVFVGNGGAIQIHTGPVHNIRQMGQWINVMDDLFTLHLRSDRVAEAWIVRKPIRDTLITAIELYDEDQNNFAIFVGERAPKDPENPAWRQLAESLPRLGRMQAAQ